MPRSTRLFEIIQILRAANSPVTAQKIADALEITPRTVYRDMAALQAMRLPIEGEAGIGYVMRSGFDLPPLMFTQEEVEAIAVGLSLIGRTGDRDLEKSAESVASKIAEVLPDEAQRSAPLRASRWNDIPVSRTEPKTLRRFIRNEEELSITYVDLNEKRTIRTVKPLALVYYIDAVLLAAWCDLRQDFRHFRIDRIQTCKPTGQRFTGHGASLVQRWEQQTELP